MAAYEIPAGETDQGEEGNGWIGTLFEVEGGGGEAAACLGGGRDSSALVRDRRLEGC